jgi:hypothetical protein
MQNTVQILLGYLVILSLLFSMGLDNFYIFLVALIIYFGYIYLCFKLEDRKDSIKRKKDLLILKKEKINRYLLGQKINKTFDELSEIEIEEIEEIFRQNDIKLKKSIENGEKWRIKNNKESEEELEKINSIKKVKEEARIIREEEKKKKIEIIEQANRVKELKEKELKEKEIKEKELKDRILKEKNEEKENVKKKILEKERKKQIENEAIQELIDAGLIDNNYYSGSNIRESIPTEVKIAVWNRDKERCVSCSSNSNLEFDHIIPVSKGGANSVKNIQLLCRNCNRTKSNKII